jgi:flagellin
MEESMPFRIFNNLASLNAQRNLGSNSDQLSLSLARIAYGLRVTKSADDAASLSISETLNSDTRTLQQGAKNLNDALSLTKTAEGALNEQAQMIIRLRELAEQSITGTIGQNQRDAIHLEFTSLVKEFDRIAKTTEFNGQKLLDGSLAKSAVNQVYIQIGLDSGSNNRISLNQEADIEATTTNTLSLDTLSVDAQSQALIAIPKLATILDTLSQARAKIGAAANRFERALSNLNVSIENLSAASSGIKDADMAQEFATLTKNQILVQSSMAMVGQSNLLPNEVLQLIR